MCSNGYLNIILSFFCIQRSETCRFYILVVTFIQSDNKKSTILRKISIFYYIIFDDIEKRYEMGPRNYFCEAMT